MARDCPRFAREEARGAPRRRGGASTPRRRRRATAAPPCPSPLAGSRGRARLAHGAGRCGRAADAVSRRLGSGARATRRRRGRAPGAGVGSPVGARVGGGRPGGGRRGRAPRSARRRAGASLVPSAASRARRAARQTSCRRLEGGVRDAGPRRPLQVQRGLVPAPAGARRCRSCSAPAPACSSASACCWCGVSVSSAAALASKWAALSLRSTLASTRRARLAGWARSLDPTL